MFNLCFVWRLYSKPSLGMTIKKLKANTLDLLFGATVQAREKSTVLKMCIKFIRWFLCITDFASRTTMSWMHSQAFLFISSTAWQRTTLVAELQVEWVHTFFFFFNVWSVSLKPTQKDTKRSKGFPSWHDWLTLDTTRFGFWSQRDILAHQIMRGIQLISSRWNETLLSNANRN